MCGARATQRETPQQGTGWPDGYRGSRTQMGGGMGAHEHKSTWTGFARVAQTTVERLLREGGSVDEDATDAPLADKLATLQHIMSGACTGTADYRTAVGRLSDATGAICRKVRRAGGTGTDLWDIVTRADA